jgi:hypothetical protein
LQVQRHIDFVARVGVVTIDPQLVVGRVHTLHPHLVDKNVSGNLIFVSAVDHHFSLRVQVAHRPGGLAESEVMYRSCGDFQTQESHNYNNCNAFHKALGFIVHYFSIAKVLKLSHPTKKTSYKPMLTIANRTAICDVIILKSFVYEKL